MTPATKPDFKIAIIGAGSVGFTKKLVTRHPEGAGVRRTSNSRSPTSARTIST